MNSVSARALLEEAINCLEHARSLQTQLDTQRQQMNQVLKSLAKPDMREIATNLNSSLLDALVESRQELHEER